VPGPPPKPLSARRRRNREPRTTLLPAEGRKGPIPKLGRKATGAWSPETREWWERIWRSPVATQWIEVDEHGLREIALLRDQSRRQPSPTLLREIRLREDAYGLSPMSRRRLRWEIGPEGGAEVRPPQTRIRRVQAIDLEGA